jgi:hypothetical protein
MEQTLKNLDHRVDVCADGKNAFATDPTGQPELLR